MQFEGSDLIMTVFMPDFGVVLVSFSPIGPTTAQEYGKKEQGVEDSSCQTRR
jgi:hypothetical protein